MNKFFYVILIAVLCLSFSPVFAEAQAQKNTDSFETLYERYVIIASSMQLKIKNNTATLSDQKTYLDAVVKLFIAQNALIASDFSTKQKTESVVSVLGILSDDAEKLQLILSDLSSAYTSSDVQNIADEVKEYSESYVSSVRQPILSAYSERLLLDVYKPAQGRYTAMKQAVSVAKSKGVNVKEYEVVLESIRLKLYEVRGFIEDIQLALSQKTFTLEQVESDMTKAQDIMKAIYLAYKDLSLKAGGIVTQ